MEAWLDLSQSREKGLQNFMSIQIYKGVLVISVNAVENLWFRDQSFIFLVTLPVHAALWSQYYSIPVMPCNQAMQSIAFKHC